MAREFKAFVRAKKVKTPRETLNRVVFLYCGLDKSLRETAADFTLLYESITDSSIAERLAAAFGRGCRRYWRKCCIPMLSPRSQRPGVSWSSTAVTSKALVLRGPSIACTSVWTWCSYNLWRLPSRISIPAKASSTSRWGLGILRWRYVWIYSDATPIVETVQKQAAVHPPD